jgi:transposase
MIEGRQMCLKATAITFGVSKKRFETMSKRYKETGSASNNGYTRKWNDNTVLSDSDSYESTQSMFIEEVR